MTIQEAMEIADQIKSLEDSLRQNFPCEECKGTGHENSKESWYGWYPCESCYGEGWLIDWDAE